MKGLIFILTLAFSFPAFATKYYQSEGSNIVEITADKFDGCEKVWYRKAGADGLSRKHKSNYVKASLTAKAINDLSAVKKRLQDHDGSCTYGSDDESF